MSGGTLQTYGVEQIGSFSAYSAESASPPWTAVWFFLAASFLLSKR